MFQTAVLASGSKGNSSLVRTENTAVLIDSGISFKRVCAALTVLDVSPQEIQAVIVSHEHSDHIKGIGPLCRKLKVPLFITEPTYQRSKSKLANIPSDVVFFKPGDYFSVGDIEVHPFPSSHDAVDACNFTLTQKIVSTESPKQQHNSLLNKFLPKLAIATDLGFCTKLLVNKLKDSTTVILESNHDMEMLMTGKYPWHLKQRVRSINGHLSNEQAIGLISQIFHPGLKNLILAHLSEENNHPEVVRKAFEDYLSAIRCETRCFLSSQLATTPLFEV